MKPTPLLLIRLTEPPASTQLRKAVFKGSLLLSLGLALGCFSLNSTAATTVVVTAQNFSFAPSSVAIFVGDSVSFNNAGGDHNVTGYNPAPPPELFCGTTLVGPGPMCAVTFTNAGVFRFRCVPHSSGSGTNITGMIGTITVTVPPTPVVVPGQPFVITGGSVTLRLTNTVNSPSIYQWQFNGTDIANATNATLALSSLTLDQSGSYSVTVSNAYQVVTTTPATVQVVDRVTIASQPLGRTVLAGTNLTLTVNAVSPLPITYQWQFNGADLPGQTSSNLTLTSVQFAQDGLYTVIATDAIRSVTSQPATLTVLVKPVIVEGPISQTVVAGDDVIFSVAVTGNPPQFSYRWRRNGQNLSGQTNATLTLLNVQTNQAGNYSVIVTNLVGLKLSSSALLTVLADTDGDHAPDDWELAYGFNPTDPSDAALDGDGDGQSNLAEYRSGTSPTNAASLLKLEGLTRANGQATVSFNAVSNQTYTVEWCAQPAGGTWSKLADVLAQSTTRTENVLDPNATDPIRFYRLVTPRRP